MRTERTAASQGPGVIELIRDSSLALLGVGAMWLGVRPAVTGSPRPAVAGSDEPAGDGTVPAESRLAQNPAGAVEAEVLA